MDKKETLVCQWCQEPYRYLVEVLDLLFTKDHTKREIGSTEEPHRAVVCIKCLAYLFKDHFKIEANLVDAL